MEEFEKFINNNENHISTMQAKNYNALVFAYIGDSVFSLYVRNYFASKSTSKAGILNTQTNRLVRASAQSMAYDYLTTLLTEQEIQIGKSARNIKTNNVAKNSNLEDYKKATSFEAVLGYLYLTNQNDRLMNLLREIINFMENNI